MLSCYFIGVAVEQKKHIRDGVLEDSDVTWAFPQDTKGLAGITPIWNEPCFTLNEYERRAMRTDPPHVSDMEGLVNAALGMCGEAGEFADLLKKIRYHGHAMDKEHLLKECGDVLWYTAQAAYYIGQIYRDPTITLGTVGEMNILKLEARYPNGFDPEKSMHRAEGDI